jgi:hypothetical protein
MRRSYGKLIGYRFEHELDSQKTSIIKMECSVEDYFGHDVEVPQGDDEEKAQKMIDSNYRVNSLEIDSNFFPYKNIHS